MIRRATGFILFLVFAIGLLPGLAFAAQGGDTIAGGTASTALNAGSIQPQEANGGTIAIGSRVNCKLTAANDYAITYTVKPAASGRYSFYSAGANEPSVRLDHVDDGYVNDQQSYADEDFFFSYNLVAGQTYRISIENSGYEDSFVFGMFPSGKGEVLISDTAVELVDGKRTCNLKVQCDHELPNAAWKCSDGSIVSVEDGEWSVSADDVTFAYGWSPTVSAIKSGKTAVSLVNTVTGTVYASCNVTCKNVAECYDIYVCGVQVTSKNSKSITGEGISGKVSYDHATNTLTLNNAKLKRADTSYGYGDGPICAIGFNGSWLTKQKLEAQSLATQAIATQGDPASDDSAPGTKETLHIKLVGNNEIGNLSSSASFIYLLSMGLYGISTPGSISLEGSGSLSIEGGTIGRAISCGGSLAVAKGVTLDMNVPMTTSPNSNGVIAGDTVTVDGTLKASIRTQTVVVNGVPEGFVGYCVKAKKLLVGSTGVVNVSASTDNDTTVYGVFLDAGGSAQVKGELTATAFGASVEKAGVGIGAEKAGSTLTVESGGTVTTSGRKSALENITPKLGKGGKAYAGSTSADAVEVSLYGIVSAYYVRLVVPEVVPGNASGDAPEVSPKAKSIVKATVTVGKATYNGKPLKPAVTVKLNNKTLKAGTDYKVSYSNNTKAGKKAQVTVTGTGHYKDSVSKTFTIAKAKNAITAKVAKKALTTKAGKAASFKTAKVFTVKAAKGKVSYKVKKYVTKSAKGKVKVSGKGVVTVAKSAKKGTYKLKVKITAAGNKNYKAGSKTVQLVVKVK